MTTIQKKRLENVKEKSDIDKHTKEQLENVKDTSDVDKHTKEKYEKVNDSFDVEKHTKEQLENDQEKSYVKSMLSLSTFVTKVKEYTVPGVDHVNHVSLGKSGTLWVSDDKGNLIQTHLQTLRHRKH